MINGIMKDKKENIHFMIFLGISILIGIIVDFSFLNESDFIVFISIILGFQITSVSILFNSRILLLFYNAKDSKYTNKLNRLASYYKSSIFFGFVSVVFVLFINPTWICLNLKYFSITKSSFYLLFFISPMFWFYKTTKLFFDIFVTPRNE